MLEIGDVALECRKWNELRACLIRSGGFLEVNLQGWRLNGAEDRIPVCSKDFEGPLTARVLLERGRHDDAYGVGKLEDGDGIIGEVIGAGAVLLQQRCDSGRLAEEADEGIDEVAAELEHLTAGEAGELDALGGGREGVDGAANLEDIAEPASTGGLKGGIDAGVVTPHVALLKEEVPTSGEAEEFAEALEIGGRWLFEVDVFAGFEREAGMPGVVGDVGFNGDERDGGVVDELLLGEQGDAEARELVAEVEVRFADAGELEARVVADDVDFGGAVGMAGAEEGGTDGWRSGSARGQGAARAA